MRPSGARSARIVFFAAGLLILGGITIHAGIGPVARTLSALKLSGLAIITLAHIPVILLMGLAWWTVGRGRAAPQAFIAARLGRDGAAEILPFSQLGGFVVGVRLLALTGFDALNGAFSMFADLIAEFAAKLVYTLLGILLLTRLNATADPIQPLFAALAWIIPVLLAATLLYWRFKPELQRLADRSVRKLMGGQGSGHVIDVFRPGRTLPSFVLHLLCWLFGAIEAWITLRLMGLDVTANQALVIDSLATAIRSLGFFVPAALGVQEAGYVLICGLLGFPPVTAVAFSLARRARDIVIGLAGLAIWQALEWRPRAPEGRLS